MVPLRFPKNRGTVKDEHQITPSVRRDSDINLRISQLDRAFIVEDTILTGAMDVNGCADS